MHHLWHNLAVLGPLLRNTTVLQFHVYLALWSNSYSVPCVFLWMVLELSCTTWFDFSFSASTTVAAFWRWDANICRCQVSLDHSSRQVKEDCPLCKPVSLASLYGFQNDTDCGCTSAATSELGLKLVIAKPRDKNNTVVLSQDPKLPFLAFVNKE